MKGERDADFSHSMTDLMSGLAVMFLVIAAIFMVQAAKATDEQRRLASLNDAAAEKLRALKNDNARRIESLKDLSEKLDRNSVLSDRIDVLYDEAVDPLLLTIRFTNEHLQFGSNECEVSSAQEVDLRVTLNALFEDLCGIVTPQAGLMQTITLEGHTDLDWPRVSACGMKVRSRCAAPSPPPECEKDAFENNVRLSAARAHYVFFLAREVLEGDLNQRCLEPFFVVSGRGPTTPIAPTRSDADRRVEIKIRVAPAPTSPGP
jgi:flagellar motor protein MotB